MANFLINELPVSGGVVGLCCCPGHRLTPRFVQPSLHTFEQDLDTIAAFGARKLVTLMQADELRYIGLDPELFEREVSRRGLVWLHIPIRNLDVPGADWETRWGDVGKDLHADLAGGGRFVMHCYAGVGRTGTVGARLLIESGMDPVRAIAAIRAARPGSIETAQQESYVAHAHWRRR